MRKRQMVTLRVEWTEVENGVSDPQWWGWTSMIQDDEDPPDLVPTAEVVFASPVIDLDSLPSTT